MSGLVRRKEFCKKLRESIDDEAKATKEYRQMGKESGSSELDIVFAKISQDEQSHKEALSKVMKLLCPIK